MTSHAFRRISILLTASHRFGSAVLVMSCPVRTRSFRQQPPEDDRTVGDQ
jgi:hypothetical protein